MKTKFLSLICVLMFAVAIFSYSFYQIFVPTNNFPINAIFTVQKQDSGEEIFKNLYGQNYIKSIFFAKIVNKFFSLTHRNNKFYQGDYSFSAPLSTFQIITELTKRPVSLAVLIPEGFTKEQIADRLSTYIKHFNKNDFLQKAQEGYLFPDTYYFFAFSDNNDVLQEFSDKFNQNMLTNFGKIPTSQQIIIASILEREARDPQDMKIISGIIQNRLKIGMPLQIDATVLYGKGIWKSQTSYSDLKNKSEYNTYLNPGLPVGPISNPGINAIKAAINPDNNDYLYYLTGKDGKMYYAKTAEEHIKNKIKYLR